MESWVLSPVTPNRPLYEALAVSWLAETCDFGVTSDKYWVANVGPILGHHLGQKEYMSTNMAPCSTNPPHLVVPVDITFFGSFAPLSWPIVATMC